MARTVAVGDRVMAYTWDGKRIGKGVVTETQSLNGSYCRVRLDARNESETGLEGAKGLTLAVRQDMCKRLVMKMVRRPKA